MSEKFKIRLCLLMLLAALPVSLVSGQSITVGGRVMDDAGNSSLPGATIVEVGTSNGTISDAQGNFSITITPGAILRFTYIGMKTYEERFLEARDNLLVSLKNEDIALEEVVVTGYLTERKADLTGSVGVVDLSEIEELPSGNIIKNIQGRLAGVTVFTDGSPGSGATIRIRGTGTLNNNDPLYVIDGVPTKSGMHELNPNDIESFQVLKDASAASIYGSRAANGVIIITTKQARDGKLSVEFNSGHTLQFYTTKLEPLNTYQRGLVYWRASVNSRLSPVSPIYKYTWNGDFDSPILGAIDSPEFIDAAQTMRPADTRWFDEISRNALIRDYNLTISKSHENSRMMFSLGSYNHDGIVRETNFNRTNMRLNSEYSFLEDLLRIGQNFTMSYQTEVLINASDVLFSSLVQHPIVPVYTEDGGWGGPVSGMTDRQNPVRLIEDYKHNNYKYIRPFGNVYAELNPIKNLTLRTSFGLDYSMYYAREFYKKYKSGFLTEPDNRLQNHVNLRGNWIWSNTATYTLSKGPHNATLLGGMEQIKYSEEWFSASREDYLVETLDYAFLSTGAAQQLNSGSGTAWALQSFFAKLNYSYKYKYLASLTFRRDGSSRFGINNRYANFPAVSVGWRISEEPFMQDNLSIPLDLKIRASWGQNGNQEINNLARFNIYRPIYGKDDPIWDNPNPPEYLPSLGTAYDIAGIDQGPLPSGFITTQIQNEDLKWETTTQTNVGLDFSLNKTFSGSIDYFRKSTSDILYYRMLLSAVGEANGQYVNGGTIENSGFEFLLDYSNKTGSLSYSISANLSFLHNEIVEMPEELTVRMPLTGIIPGEAKTELPTSLLTGQSVNAIYGYVADGIFQDEQEVSEHAEQPGKAVGRIRYRDISGPDGDIDGVIDNYDQEFMAVADPDFTFGLNINLMYKNWTFDMFVQGIQGIEVYNSYKTYTDFASLWPGTNWGTRTLDAWSETNKESTIPKLTIIDSNNEGRLSTYFIENGSYLKLRNIQVGYTVKTGDSPGLGWLKGCRIYAQGQNILTLKSRSFTGTDPENPSYAFPIPASYTLGIRLSL